MSETEDRVADHIESTYPDVVAAIEAAATAASDDWPATGVRDSATVRDSFRRALTNEGVRASLPEVLVTAVEAAGGSLRANPVSAPPYVVVTSLGILLRATLADARLVIELRAFEQEDGRYQRRDTVAITARLV